MKYWALLLIAIAALEYFFKQAMNPEAQRIAIASVCGHKDIALRLIAEGTGMDCELWCSGILGEGGYEIPEYLYDLNAMQKAETCDAIRQAGYARYIECLAIACGTERLGALVFSTAAQRAEAFLRTLNLWNTSK